MILGVTFPPFVVLTMKYREELYECNDPKMKDRDVESAELSKRKMVSRKNLYSIWIILIIDPLQLVTVRGRRHAKVQQDPISDPEKLGLPGSDVWVMLGE